MSGSVLEVSSGNDAETFFGMVNASRGQPRTELLPVGLLWLVNRESGWSLTLKDDRNFEDLLKNLKN